MSGRTWRLVLPAVLGGLLVGVWIGARCERAASRRMRREGPSPEKVLRMFRRELKLRDDQVDPIRRILDAKRPEFQTARRDAEARNAALRSEIDKDISALLDDEQKAKQAELHARWERRLKEQGPPDGPR